MNGWQVARQIKHLLAGAKWPDGTQDVVFGRVLVSAGPSRTGVEQLRFPFALVIPLDAEADGEDPDLLMLSRFNVRVVTRVANDNLGETVMIGGARTGGQGGSGGRGLLELEEIVMDVVSAAAEQNGIRLRVEWTSAVDAAEDEELGYVASRTYRLEAFTTSDRSYKPPSRLKSTDAGGGQADLTWLVPPDRYDRKALVLRRAFGSTPPATPTSGVGVTVGDLDSSASDTPGVGTWSYSLFMGYDELGTGSSDRFSPAATVTITLS